MNCERCGDVLTEKDELEHSIVDNESYGVAGSPAEIIFLCAECFYWARVDDGEDNIPIVRDNKKGVSDDRRN